MAEYDSDLEGKDEQIIIHGTESNTKQLSKKRTFREMQDDDNHYSSNHSNNKSQKFDHESNEDVNAFLNDSELDEDDIEEAQNEGIRLDAPATSMLQDVEFELKDMDEMYYHEVKDIVSATEWDQKKLNVIQLTETIINQQEIGGILMSQSSVLGFITLLSFKKYFEHLSLAHVKRFLLNRCKQTRKKKFENYFGDKHNIGLLLHERPINTPLELVPHIYESLYKDIEYATNKQLAKHLNDAEIESFKCDYILMVVRYRWVAMDDKEEENKDNDLLPHLMHTRNKMKLVYEHLEDDLFVKNAQFQFDFERNDKMWNVLVVKMTDLKDIVQRMHQLFTPQK